VTRHEVTVVGLGDVNSVLLWVGSDLSNYLLPANYYYYTIWMCLVTGISSRYFSWTSGDPHRSGFKLHTAVLSVLCDVLSIAVFCSESIECFPGTASKFFLKLLVTIPVAPIITGIIVHFRFHIHCISIHKLLYFNFFSLLLLLLLLLFTLLSICLLGNLHLSQIVGGIRLNQGKEIRPIP